MKISVVMASYLGYYPNAASNRNMKFKRAVQSFLDQSYENKELIVVSDGCELTTRLFMEMFPDPGKNKIVNLPEQGEFSGLVRQYGIQAASGDIICYLDTDDVFFGNHLQQIAEGFEGISSSWVYYNDFVAMSADLSQKRQRGTQVQQGCIGTSSIAHLRSLPVKWPDGYGHDWRLVEDMKNRFFSYKPIRTEGYLVCHIPGVCDF